MLAFIVRCSIVAFVAKITPSPLTLCLIPHNVEERMRDKGIEDAKALAGRTCLSYATVRSAFNGKPSSSTTVSLIADALCTHPQEISTWR